MNVGGHGADRGNLDVAVVAPLEDPRGDIAEHIGTWLRGQRLPRERYQLVVAGNGEHPDFERRVTELLAPHDAFVSVPRASLMELYAAAADAARAPVLLITEAHCQADPACLEAIADGFAADPDLDAATLNFQQLASGDLSELIERWVDVALEAWEREDWCRFHVTGVAIRNEAYARAGGIDPRFGQFATSYLGARLHYQGSRVGHLERATLTHLVEDSMAESLSASRSFARGECVVRAENDPEFCERYFGPAGVWERRLAYRPDVARSIVSALSSAIRRSPRDAGWLLRELVPRLPAAIAGVSPRAVWERAKARLHAIVAGATVAPRETRWRSLVAAQESTVAAVRLQQGARENGLAAPPDSGRIGPAGLDGVMAGTHGLEQEGDRHFRWTEPVSLLRMAPPEEDSVLRIRVASPRHDPLQYLQGVYVAGDPLPPELLSGDAETLEARLPAHLAKRIADRGIVLVFRPRIPSRDGSEDPRRLGVPVVEIEVSPA